MPEILLDHLATDMLRCPACGHDGLTLQQDALECPACSNRFPAEPGINFATLVPPSLRENDAKLDIQKWWGDLYQQLYSETDANLTTKKLLRLVDDFEDLMEKRGHLAVVEMPLSDLKEKRVLEIGPGGGGHSCLFKKYGAVVTVADITPERALSATKKLALMDGSESAGFNADGEKLPFQDDYFDIVYSNGVLHHAEDTDRCIAEVHRVLKPGGRAIIMLYSRHSSVFWLNIAPRGLLTGEIFRWPEAEWIGRLTEGRRKHGITKNPFTRVYSKREIQAAFSSFNITSLRKSSFQLDNFAIPKLSQIRRILLSAFGHKPHPGGVLVYGSPFMLETPLELALGPVAGFSWNIIAEKSLDPRRPNSNA